MRVQPTGRFASQASVPAYTVGCQGVVRCLEWYLPLARVTQYGWSRYPARIITVPLSMLRGSVAPSGSWHDAGAGPDHGLPEGYANSRNLSPQRSDALPAHTLQHWPSGKGAPAGSSRPQKQAHDASTPAYAYPAAPQASAHSYVVRLLPVCMVP